MLCKRIIPCLDIKDGRTVKGTNFVNLRDAGDPVELGALYAQQGADELVFLDITATVEKRKTLRELVNRIQKIRKDNGFELTDRIEVQIGGAETLMETIRQFNYYICAEILADQLELVPEVFNGTLIEVNEVPLTVFVTKKA